MKLSRSKSGEGFDVAIEKTVNAVATAAAAVPGVAKLGGEAGVGTSDRTTMHYNSAAEASHAAQQAELGMAANELRVGAGMARNSIGDVRAPTRNFLNQAPGAGQGPSLSLFNPIGMLTGTLSLSELQGPASTSFAVKAAMPGAGMEASVGMIDQTRRPVWTGTLDSKPPPAAKPGAGKATPEQRKWIRDHFGVDMEELPSAPTH